MILMESMIEKTYRTARGTIHYRIGAQNGEDQDRYAKLSGYGFRMPAEAVEADLQYGIHCPAMLICGEKDRAGSCIRYNKAWHKNTGIRLIEKSISQLQ